MKVPQIPDFKAKDIEEVKSYLTSTNNSMKTLISYFNQPAQDMVYLFKDATNSNIPVFLPSAKETDKIHFIKKTDKSTNEVVITPKPGQLIDFATSYSLKSVGAYVKLKPVDGKWEVIDRWFAPAYAHAYRIAGFTITNNNTWYTMGWSGGTNNLSNITLGDFNAVNGDDTNNKLTMAYAGAYKITYNLIGYNAGAVSNFDSRLMIDDTAAGELEIIGSYAQSVNSAAGYRAPFSRVVLVALAASNYISIQVGASGAGSQITSINDPNSPDPDDFIVANLTIKKIDE